METEYYLQFGKWGGPYQTVKVEGKTTDCPYWHSASGYGNKIPTQHMVKYNNRWRRVYVVCYSNVGTAYCHVNGEKVIVNTY